MPRWLIFLYLICISQCICNDTFLSPSDGLNSVIPSTDNNALNNSDSMIQDIPPSGPTDSVDSSQSKADPFVVVVKRSNSTKTALAEHVKWLHEISADQNVSSRLLHNVTSIGKFSWYAGLFDEETLLTINSSSVVHYISKDIVFQSYNYVQVNPPSWGLRRISQRTLPLNNRYSYPEDPGKGVTIYVVDTGVRLNHIDLENRATFGTALVGNQSDQGDQNGHGTFVSGIIAGKNYGVAKSANIVSVCALEPDGSGKLSTILKALDWITQMHLNSTNKKSIVNLSLGAEYNQAANEAVQNAIQLGIHFTIAAGNEGKDACQYSPASAPGALTVGATAVNDTIASYSNTGSCVDIYAPGSGIISLWNTSATATHSLSGTSMASPHAAGLMAILLSRGNYTPPELIQMIMNMSTPNTTLQNGLQSGGNYPPSLLYTDGGDQNVSTTSYSKTNTATSTATTHSFQCMMNCVIVGLVILVFA